MTTTITAADLNGQNHKVPIGDVHWRPSAYGIVIENGKILLCPYKRGGYALPGGGLEILESIEQAAEREVKEETGLDTKFVRLLDTRESFFYPDDAGLGKNAAYHSLLFYCEMKYLGGEISAAGFDDWEKEHALLAEWVDLDRLDEIPVIGTVDWREIVKNFLSSTRA
jgi:ADP-ribose pyrophosphatase YjhB (NUDIX family)